MIHHINRTKDKNSMSLCLAFYYENILEVILAFQNSKIHYYITCTENWVTMKVTWLINLSILLFALIIKLLLAKSGQLF